MPRPIKRTRRTRDEMQAVRRAIWGVLAVMFKSSLTSGRRDSDITPSHWRRNMTDEKSGSWLNTKSRYQEQLTLIEYSTPQAHSEHSSSKVA